MKSFVVAASFALCVASLSTGCPGGTTGEGEGEGGEGEGATSADDVTTALNNYLDRCGVQIFGFEAQKEPVLTGILATQFKPFIDQDFTQLANDPNITFDTAQAAKCVTEINALACGAGVVGLNAGAPDCATTFVGKLADGAACAASDECVHGSECKGLDTTQGTCGTCTATVNTVGGDCTNADCGEGLDCVNNQCETAPTQPTLHAGDSCVDFGCGSDQTLVCDQTQHCTAVNIVQVGDTCDTSPGVNYCVDTATKNFCDPTTNTCTARPGLNGDCSTIPLCDATVAVCDQTGTCVAAKADGDACTVDTNGASDCGAGLQCNASTCGPELVPPTNPTCN